MLSSHLRECGETRFTGRLVISSPQGQSWQLLYVRGRVVGDGRGIHPIRRWRRQLSQHCPELETAVQLKLAEFSEEACDLEALLRPYQLPHPQINRVIEGSLSEIFFDLAQHLAQLEQPQAGWVSVQQQPASGSTRPESDTLIKAEFLWSKAQQQWQDWQNSGLGPYSPNLAVQILAPAKLQQEVSDLTYRKLSSLMDGRRTLRDLAVKLGQDVRLLTQSLCRYIRAGTMGVVEVPDLSSDAAPITSISVTPLPESGRQQLISRTDPTQQPAPLGALIACIDDSPFICKALGDVVVKAGYRYVAIQDSLQAIPTLLKHKPDMIFLDLVMPIANGYEVCTQIRRVARFRETPIVILTGQDGIFDRVRAKLVGSTDFLPKPVEADKILQMIDRHLISRSSGSQTQLAPAAPPSSSASYSVG